MCTATLFLTGSLKGGDLSAQLALQDVRLFDCCSDPGVHECVLQRLDPASPVAAIGGELLSPSRAWGSGLTGLGLSQAQGLQRLSPEAFGWSCNAMPAVASGLHMRRAGAASADGRAPVPALLTVGLQLQGGGKHVSVLSEPLQLLARPGCLVAVKSMLEQLPQDTLQHRLASAQADIAAAAEGCAFSSSKPSQPPAASSVPAGAGAAASAGVRSVRFDETDRPVPPGSPKVGARAVKQQPLVPAALTQLQVTFQVSELLLVLPTELQYAAGVNAVLHLQGLKLAGAQAPATAAAGASSSPQHSPTEQLQYVLSDDDNDDSPTAQAASSQRERTPPPQQQQFALALLSLFVGVYQAPRELSANGHPSALPHRQQQQLAELLKLPPVQGTVWLSSQASTERSAQAGTRRSSQSESGQTWPPPPQALLKISLQVPPVSCCLTASLLSVVQQAVKVAAWQSHLRLPELVATYNQPLRSQLQMAAATTGQQQQQPQEQQEQPGASAQPAAPAGACSNGAAAVEPVGSRTASPTESEVAQWLAAPAASQPADDDDAADAESLRLRRCDSDKLLHVDTTMASSEQQQRGIPHCGNGAQAHARSKQQRQPQRLTQADAAALLAAPEVLLLDFELLLEELDIQFIQDVAPASTEQKADPQPGSGGSILSPSMQAGSAGGAVSSASPSLHARLQASLLSIGFTHSTHGSRAEAGLKDLVVQDMLSDTAEQVLSAGVKHSRAAGVSAGVSAAAAAAGPAALLRLFSSMSIEELQVGWSRQLSQAATLQDVQVVLGGLQIQVRAHIMSM